MTEFLKLNTYKIMWLFVSFDLPVMRPEERRSATQFRNALLEAGFVMHQYSVYIRHCASKEVAKQHVRNIRSIMPSSGHVSILQVTDLQYSQIINVWGGKKKKLKTAPKQLELF